MFLILSAGVGGSVNTYGGAISPTSPFPCSVFIDWVRVYQLGYPLEVDETGKDPYFIVYPNPASDRLYIQIDHPEDYPVTMTDLSGKTVLHTFLDHTATLDISGLEKGIYLVQADNGDITLSKRVVIQ
jgi:hypothetical protein